MTDLITDYNSEEIYDKLHAGDEYGVGDHGWSTRNMIEPGKTMLEIGPSKGKYAAYQQTRGVDVTVMDLSSVAVEYQRNVRGVEKCVHGSITDIPFGDNSFDVVVCFDTLEHLREEDVPKAIQEIKRVAREQAIVTISNYSSTRDGYELHLTRKPHEWWVELMKTIGRVETLPLPEPRNPKLLDPIIVWVNE